MGFAVLEKLAYMLERKTKIVPGMAEGGSMGEKPTLHPNIFSELR